MSDMSGTAAPRALRLCFVVTICTGSFLLFLVQPMIARMALPRLGGAPAVWNSAMLVYQALLLGGYAYAHGLGRLAARRQALVHILLFVAAAAMLPIGLIAGNPPPDFSPIFWVPWLLVASIGPLFFVVAAQAPLMQRWFALSGGGDPYPLYAASNLGSFAGLLAYPLLVEPFMPVAGQRWLWTGGYALLLVLVIACARLLPADATAERAVTDAGARPTTRQFLMWILLAAVPSGLMLSTSLHLTTDIVAMPLLWVMPLGLYLLSFSVAFSEGRALASAITAIAPLILLMGACSAFADASDYAFVIAFVTLLVLFVTAVALHSQMYDLRPAPAHLTRFYLAMSIGGALGGVFCALIAPLVFDWTYEHPILIALAALLLVREPLFAWAGRLWTDPARAGRLTAWLLLVGFLASMVGDGVLLSSIKSDGVKAACFVLIIAIGVVAIGNRWLYAGCAVYLMLCLGGWGKLALSANAGTLTRSYFGVYMVRNNGPEQRLLVHGTTVHGIQNRAKGRELEPTSYYAPLSGVGLAMKAAPELYGPHARIGIVGLGAGTLACYRQPGQQWRFYEIDPAIVGIARDPKNFNFLQRCQPDADIAVGDARIVLAGEPSAGLDVLAIDAFSSDTVPMHLLTREAFDTYARRLTPNGLLLVHISNRYLDLQPVIAAAAREGGWQAAMRYYRPSAEEKARNYSASIWIVLSHDPTVLTKLETVSGKENWEAVEMRPGFGAWTDDHGSILPILRIWER